MDLNQLIFDMYFGAAKNAGIVWTLQDLAERDGLYDGLDEDFDLDDIPEFAEHGDAIEHVMYLEISYFVFRHLNGPWGEVVDGLLRARNQFSNDYRKKTGYQIDTKQNDLLA